MGSESRMVAQKKTDWKREMRAKVRGLARFWMISVEELLRLIIFSVRPIHGGLLSSFLSVAIRPVLILVVL